LPQTDLIRILPLYAESGAPFAKGTSKEENERSEKTMSRKKYEI
jgi:hypothetical protein